MMTLPNHDHFRPTRDLICSQRGTSLIEILVAALVISIGVLGLAPMMVASISATQFATSVTSVVAAAEQSIEVRLGAGGFGTLPLTETSTSGNGKYHLTTVVTDDTVDPAIPSHLYEINVTVTWIDDRGASRSMIFTTYTAKP
jgi:type II secretory pathway pseudopilin PulG